MPSKALNISLALILLYGLVPYLYVNLLGNGNLQIIDITLSVLFYSLIAGLSLFLFSKVKIKRISRPTVELWLSENEASFFGDAIFLLSLIFFLLFPWHETREGVFASISALFRMLWIMVAIPQLKGRKAIRMLLFTTLLMFIDGSRTFGFIIFIYYFINHKIPLTLMLGGIISILLVASFRNGLYSFDVNLLLHGIFGEGVNGSSGIFQVIQAKSDNSSWPVIQHLFYTFFQPLLVVLNIIAPSNLLSIDSSQFMSSLVNDTLAQSYYPMGGFYLLSEFAPYGYLGIGLFCIYFFITFRLSSVLLDSKKILFAPTLLFMMIKSSPFTYWKWVIWFLIFQFLFKFIITGLKNNNE